MRIGYLRVSTQEQRPDRQIDGLRDRCDQLCLETLSAVSPRRPVYESVVEGLQEGDTLVVWDLDRAFRSVLDAVTQAERLRAKGVEFEIANLRVDTATPAGMLVYTIMSACAEFERRVLAQRTREGLAAARLRGARLGRPPKLDDGQLDRARCRLSSADGTTASLARELGVAPWTLTRSLRRERRELAQPVVVTRNDRNREVLGIEKFTVAEIEAIRRADPSRQADAFNHELTL